MLLFLGRKKLAGWAGEKRCHGLVGLFSPPDSPHTGDAGQGIKCTQSGMLGTVEWLLLMSSSFLHFLFLFFFW